MAPDKKNDSGNESSFLEIVNVTKKFGDFTALKDVSLHVRQGELVCFLGPSGCGKTTLLRAIAGLDFQTTGRIYLKGRDISDLPPADRDFGIVFQSYALFPNLTVEKNIGYGLVSRKMASSAVRQRVNELLDLVGLAGSGGKYPAALSGGQQQRVALARALATSPGMLLLDEPLSALDAKVRVHLRHEIKELQRKLGVTTIMVTHDQEEALSMADRIVVMNHGIIEQVGTPTEIYRNPSSLFVADFVGSMNQLRGTAAGPDKAKLGKLTLTCQNHSLGKGEAGIIAVRPEDVLPQTSASRSKTKGNNVFKGTIREMEFLGSFWRAEITGGPLGDQALLADFSMNAVRRMALEEGKTLHFELPAERVKLFPPNNVEQSE
ncbi:MAG: putative 2-aminoethylphosphonate ABC transporter ATP-binding protein [Alphaproteobacteria bacterium]|nr:MAG: putative 2-aminoethylphosphonate ABC transporter ATP-binding protein [Alphaproteobacteria bacterium]